MPFKQRYFYISIFKNLCSIVIAQLHADELTGKKPFISAEPDSWGCYYWLPNKCCSIAQVSVLWIIFGTFCVHNHKVFLKVLWGFKQTKQSPWNPEKKGYSNKFKAPEKQPKIILGCLAEVKHLHQVQDQIKDKTPVLHKY